MQCSQELPARSAARLDQLQHLGAAGGQASFVIECGENQFCGRTDLTAFGSILSQTMAVRDLPFELIALRGSKRLWRSHWLDLSSRHPKNCSFLAIRIQHDRRSGCDEEST